MKILDQYIYAIGKKLPYSMRNEVKKELNSLLLDEIESTYGNNPTEEQVKQLIQNYGSPSSVANRYKSNNQVIATGYTDLYFFIMKIIIFAITIAFTVTFIIELIRNGFTATAFVSGLVTFIFRVFQSTLSGLGSLTLIFIIFTHFKKDEIVNLDENWSVNELKDIQIGPKEESLFKNIFSIIVLTFMLLLVNIAPHLVTVAEGLFEISGLSLGHHIAIERFTFFLIFITIIWILEIIYHIAILATGVITKTISIFELIIDVSTAVLFGSMLFDKMLYVNHESILGFQAIFALIFIITLLEIPVKLHNLIKHFYIEKDM